ncbi:MAG: YbjN domain-containing protein [Parvularcula sp.]|jgi:hypothetical protein|nr:YbjN domain-containing protein [Parvularcula sp.]
MTRSVLALLTICVGVAMAGPALGTSSKIRNPSAPLTSLHAEALIPIITQMELSYEGVTLPGGQKVLLVQAPDGAKFQVTPTACDQQGRCRGLHISSMFKTDADRRTVSAFNDRYAFVSAGMTEDKVAYLTRYEIADFGMPRGNLAVSLEVFIETAALFAEHLGSAERGLKGAPHASDLAATGLNMQTLMHSVRQDEMQNAVAPHGHALSFEETYDIVATFLRAETLYPGKIVNDAP